jgi:hypothetical protein
MSIDCNIFSCGSSSPVGRKTKIAGASGTVTIRGDLDSGLITAEFQFTGKLAGKPVDISEGAINLPTGFDATDCEKYIGTVISVGGIAHRVNSFEIVLQAVLSQIPNAADPYESGVYAVKITGADPQVTMNIVSQDIAFDDLMGDMYDDLVRSNITITCAKSKIVLSGAQIYQLATEDAGGFLGENITVSINAIQIEQV